MSKYKRNDTYYLGWGLALIAALSSEIITFRSVIMKSRLFSSNQIQSSEASMSKEKSTKKRKLKDNNFQGPSKHTKSEDSEDDEEAPLKPIQPSIYFEELAPFIDKVYPTPSRRWKKEYVKELGMLMSNRSGFNCTHDKLIAEAGLAGKMSWFFREYVDLYENDDEFDNMIDPWYVICEGADQIGPAYDAAINDANRHVNGQGSAGMPDEPIQFDNNRNWILHCANRESALEVAAFLHGRLSDTHPAFHTSVVDIRFNRFK